MSNSMLQNLVIGAILINFCVIDLVNGVGSKTYETSNGFPISFLNDIVNSDVVAKKLTSRWKWEVWDVVPGTHAYQIYVFNITNPDEVEKGGKPALKQLGPYYYREYRFKFDVSVNLDLSVNFIRNFTYTFDPTKSNGTEDDTVNTINVPFVIFSSLVSKYTPGEVNRVVSTLVASGESIIRRNTKIKELVFGGMNVDKYKQYLNLMGPKTALTDEFAEGRHAVLKLKSGVHEGQFTVDSGLKIEKNVGNIITYNGLNTLTYWDGDVCNQIQGSEGSTFPPQRGTSDKLYMLEVDLCRSIYFEYESVMQFRNVQGNVYRIGNDVLEDSATYSENSCFCHNTNVSNNMGGSSGSCLKKGVLDVSSCQFGAPYVMSYAHFLDASPEYQKGVTGLNPQPNLHRTRVAIEPVTGAIITFHKRFQWNIWIRPLSNIDYFSKFSSMIVPILWNDDVFTLDPDKAELLMEEVASRAGGMGSGSSQTQKQFPPLNALGCLFIFSIWLIQ